MMWVAVIVYVIAGMVILSGKQPRALTLTEKMFIPAAVIVNILLLTFAFFVITIGFVVGILRLIFKR